MTLSLSTHKQTMSNHIIMVASGAVMIRGESTYLLVDFRRATIKRTTRARLSAVPICEKILI